MRIKTIFIILIAILLIIVLLQNNSPVSFSFLWADFRISKLTMLLIVSIIAFVLGILVGRPKRVRRLGGDYMVEDPNQKEPGTLSDEDREYIN